MLKRGSERVHVVVGSMAANGRDGRRAPAGAAHRAPRTANSSHDCRQSLRPPQTISMH
ncbi:hypothetical protein BURMUCGD2M_5781 [Burkholderia multivorans CGD2M]|uniref:Uncharacterized protein n=1 Tax=Burkholderia multivorans CGD2 TaxID=513052 RepID=B9BL34_9BURK|nr:hypothetical protein BURMUCGD2_5792 [Burkholderia multivorans CGD2]EEE16336.1 hypothetical protein BURMUCGD2M_5781 [Burkholderia multivorans CGD2M]